ncbi:MAG: hypothetical protein D6778_07080 [Nitrospirae bacterium]|nr:MAG: hypothetical protein D6778_07080 [Nitrospirota bacterium]
MHLAGRADLWSGRFTISSSFCDKITYRMKRLIAIIGFILVLGSTATAGPVTPYGDFCPKCSKYGYCRRPLSKAESIEAINEYYRAKGLEVRIVEAHGRFLKVNVYKKDKLVDTVIFDRRTGRLRSIR